MLHEMNFEFAANENFDRLPIKWSHSGVVGSGDMEVLILENSDNGKVSFKITTPVRGFDDIWEKVLSRFVKEANIGNVTLKINDNNSTPFVVAMRLKQAHIEAMEAVKGGAN